MTEFEQSQQTFEQLSLHVNLLADRDNQGIFERARESAIEIADGVLNAKETLRYKLPVWAAIGAVILPASGVGLIETTSAAQAETAAGASHYKTRYYDREKGALSVVAGAKAIQHCQQLNVRFTKTNALDPFPFPHGSIEEQTASVANNSVVVSTKLRDVNWDNASTFYNRLATEFNYGCTYTTGSSTTVQLLKKSNHKLVEQPIVLKYQEKPRIYHPKEFLTKSFRSTFKLPGPFRAGQYCISNINESHSIARPFDPNAVSGYMLKDPTSDVAMLKGGDKQPAPLKKSWITCLSSRRQTTIQHPKNSPWSKH